MGEWDVLHEGFLLKFTLEDWWSDIVNDMVQVVKSSIYKIPQEQLEMLQPEWATQLSNDLECYSMQVEEHDDDPRNINVTETEGYHKVRGIEDLDITAPIKMKKVNAGTKVEPKYGTL